MKRISSIIGVVLGAAAIIVIPLKTIDYLSANYVEMDKFNETCTKIELNQAQIKSVIKRMDQQVDFATKRALEERNWDLEKRYNTRDPLRMPVDVRDEYRRNAIQIIDIKDKWGLK